MAEHDDNSHAATPRTARPRADARGTPSVCPTRSHTLQHNKSVQVGAKDGRNAKEGLLHERERRAHKNRQQERAGKRESHSRSTAAADSVATAAKSERGLVQPAARQRGGGGAHISVRVLRIIVRVRVPEAPAAHPHPLATLLANNHLHDEFVARQLELVFDPVLDLVGNLARPLRGQLGVVPARRRSGKKARRVSAVLPAIKE